jgi:acyl carrier protein phosphodiesterase
MYGDSQSISSPRSIYLFTGNPRSYPLYIYIGIYVRGIPDRILPTLHHITKAEGDLLAEMSKIATASVDVIYDACSFIHMWGRYPTLQDGLFVAMEQIVRFRV